MPLPEEPDGPLLASAPNEGEPVTATAETLVAGSPLPSAKSTGPSGAGLAAGPTFAPGALVADRYEVVRSEIAGDGDDRTRPGSPPRSPSCSRPTSAPGRRSASCQARRSRACAATSRSPTR